MRELLQIAGQSAGRESELMGAEGEGNCRVLVAEDDPPNQLVIQRMLAKLGIASALVGNGLACVERLAAEPDGYGLVLMDLQMPEMSGPEAARQIRCRLGLAALPIIALTANASPIDRERCFAAGMNDFLPKPIDLEALQHLLWRYLPLGGREKVSLTPVQAIVAGDAAIGAADRRAALFRMGNDAGLYAACLSALLAAYAGFGEQLRDLLADAAQHDEAMRLAHALKGAAHTVGAELLAERAENLWRVLADGLAAPAALARLDALAPVLDETLAACRAMLAEPGRIAV